MECASSARFTVSLFIDIMRILWYMLVSLCRYDFMCSSFGSLDSLYVVGIIVPRGTIVKGIPSSMTWGKMFLLWAAR